MEENTSRRGDVELLKHLWVKKWKHDHLFEMVDMIVQTAHTIKIDVLIDTERVDVSQHCFVSRDFAECGWTTKIVYKAWCVCRSRCNGYTTWARHSSSALLFVIATIRITATDGLSGRTTQNWSSPCTTEWAGEVEQRSVSRTSCPASTATRC